jgi:hypothetical protein
VSVRFSFQGPRDTREGSGTGDADLRWSRPLRQPLFSGPRRFCSALPRSRCRYGDGGAVVVPVRERPLLPPPWLGTELFASQVTPRSGPRTLRRERRFCQAVFEDSPASNGPARQLGRLDNWAGSTALGSRQRDLHGVVSWLDRERTRGGARGLPIFRRLTRSLKEPGPRRLPPVGSFPQVARAIGHRSLGKNNGFGVAEPRVRRSRGRGTYPPPAACQPYFFFPGAPPHARRPRGRSSELRVCVPAAGRLAHDGHLGARVEAHPEATLASAKAHHGAQHFDRVSLGHRL